MVVCLWLRCLSGKVGKKTKEALDQLQPRIQSEKCASCWYMRAFELAKPKQNKQYNMVYTKSFGETEKKNTHHKVKAASLQNFAK